MLSAALDVVMLGSSTIASSCCVAATPRSSRRTYLLAVAMPVAMATAMFAQCEILAWVLGAAALALSISLLGPARVALHRGLGGVVMSALIFVHLYLMDMVGAADHHGASGSGHHATHGGHVVDHGQGTHALVGAAVVASAGYVLWTFHELRRTRTLPASGRAMAEFVSMAVSVATMALGTLVELHTMHG